MKYRKRRIAWSVAWGSLAALVAAAWIGSFWCYDAIQYPVGFRILGIESLNGRLKLKQTGIGDPNRLGRLSPRDDRRLILERDDIYHESGGFHRSNPITARDASLGGNRYGFWCGDDGFRTKVVIVPDWLPFLICVSTSGALWLPWRFSLRTLLIATTLVAAGLGLIIWFAR